MRNRYHIAKKRYNKNKNETNKLALGNISKEYKKTINVAYRKHNNERIETLRKLKSNNPREYWKEINAQDNKTKTTKAKLQDLYEFLKKINEGDQKQTNINEENELIEEQNIEEENNIPINEEMSSEITEEEIIKATKELKNNKSPGIDNILNEHIKYTLNTMQPLYKKLFNLI